MKIRSVTYNNRKKAFEVTALAKTLVFPYAKVNPKPTAEDSIGRVFVDKELGREGFTYVLESGKEGTVHIEQVLEYNQDPRYLRDLLLYKLTIEAQNGWMPARCPSGRSYGGLALPRPNSTGFSIRRTTANL